ncbi:hypothetical protein ACFWXA_31985 [Streptomyces atroolivaceus]|uniref:hypothetical protein n=1 Tax=Streptomyces atroolivaceus TaxID=66869 RepID=UPI003655BC68
MPPEIPNQRRRPGRGQISPQPEGFYEPDIVREEAGPVIEFFGEDGRRATYSFADLPCSGLHADLAAAWARRTGATGGLRTRGAADHSWGVVTRLVKWLGELSRPPRTLRGLTLSHLRRFDQHRRQTVQGTNVVLEMAQVRALLKDIEPADLLREEVREYLHRPGQLYGRWREERSKEPPPGYSDREFAAIMAAARKDVVAIRQRLRASRTLIDRLETAPHTLSEDEQARAEELTRMLRTGEVPPPMKAKGNGGHLPDLAAQRDHAGQVFLTTQDLPALMLMGVGLSGRNGETVKELSAAHRVLDGRAVAVNLIKRRRNKTRTRKTIHWEVGSESSRLHTSGGWFLLLHEMAESSRAFSRSQRVWSIWTGDTAGGPEEFRAARSTAKGHIDPFSLKLARQFEWNKWVARHGLTADAANDDTEPEPLVLTLNRLKKTAEVRTTRAVGGHLPSVSRTNTPDVSFLHYLRNDPTIRDWAEEILTEALEDTEASARAFRGRILDEQASKDAEHDPEATAEKLGTTADKLTAAIGGELDTLVASCLDFEHSPQSNGGLCDVSFLTCLRCPNALVAERHLPKLFALLRWLQDELERRGVDDWIARHGVTWLIITRLILPKFTEAQQEQARAKAPMDLPLHLLDGLKEPS